jgi:cholesterol transport system auxiliary component
MRHLLALTLVLLAGCSIGPAPRDAVATYDFGPEQARPAGNPARIPGTLLVPNATAPAWLDSTALVYRLAYQDASRHQTYAATRWAAPPPQLFTQRLVARLTADSEGGVVTAGDGVRADHALRVEVLDFTQVFDAADRSRASIRVRATLVDLQKRSVVAQRTFSAEPPAATANAEGGARALASGADAVVGEIIAWAATSLRRQK